MTLGWFQRQAGTLLGIEPGAVDGHMERLAMEHAAASQVVVASGPDTPRVSVATALETPASKSAPVEDAPERDLIAELPAMDDADVLALANRGLRGESAGFRALTKAARDEARRRDPEYRFTRARKALRDVIDVDATGGLADPQAVRSPATPDRRHQGKGR